MRIDPLLVVFWRNSRNVEIKSIWRPGVESLKSRRSLPRTPLQARSKVAGRAPVPPALSTSRSKLAPPRPVDSSSSGAQLRVAGPQQLRGLQQHAGFGWHRESQGWGEATGGGAGSVDFQTTSELDAGGVSRNSTDVVSATFKRL